MNSNKIYLQITSGRGPAECCRAVALILEKKRLLLEAKRKIVTSGLSFQEIAFDLGCKDASYFTRFFNTPYGNTAEDFKGSLSQ